MDTVVVQGQVADQTAHNQAMIAKADGLQTTPGDQSQQAPQGDQQQESKLLAGKYKSVEDLEKGYSELVKLLGKQGKIPADPAQPTQQPTPGATPNDPAQQAQQQQDQAKQTVTDAGLDFNKYTQEFSEKGSISEESYTELAAKGISKETVDAYIAGQQALAELQIAELQGTVGGAEKYGELVQWAAANLPKGDIDAFNKALDGTKDEAKLAILGLQAKFKAANPTFIQGSPAGSAPTGYQSRAEMTKDMSDPRYAKDPAFRRQVEQKIAHAAPGVI